MNTKEDVLEYIESNNIKIVSFDIFDTLLLRIWKTESIQELCASILDIPIDLWNFLRNREKQWWPDINNEDVGLHRYKSLIEKGRMVEMNVEMDTLQPHKWMYELYSVLLNKGYKIVITTDMYLPHNFLEELLKKKGLNGFDKIYRSSSENSKKNRKLFGEIISDYPNISPREILHIGNDYYTDYKNALLCGLSAIHVPSPFDLFKKSKLNDILRPHTLGDKLLYGVLINEIFDDPFLEYKGYTNGLMYNWDLLVGTYFVSFNIWFTKELNLDHIDKLLLINRDGYIESVLLHKFSNYMNVPNYELLELNRILRGADRLLSEGVSLELLTRDYLLPSYFNIEPRLFQEIYIKAKNTKKLSSEEYEFLQKSINFENIIRSSNSFHKYVTQLLSNDVKIGLFDNGGTGSSIKYLNRYFPELKNKEIMLYMMWSIVETQFSKSFNDSSTFKFLELDYYVKSAGSKVIRINNEMTEKPIFEYSPHADYNLKTKYSQLITFNLCDLFLSLFGKYLGYIFVSKYSIVKVIDHIFDNAEGADKSILNLDHAQRVPNKEIPLLIDLLKNTSESDHNDMFLSLCYYQKSVNQNLSYSLELLGNNTFTDSIVISHYLNLLYELNKNEQFERVIYNLSPKFKNDPDINLTLARLFVNTDIVKSINYYKMCYTQRVDARIELSNLLIKTKETYGICIKKLIELLKIDNNINSWRCVCCFYEMAIGVSEDYNESLIWAEKIARKKPEQSIDYLRLSLRLKKVSNDEFEYYSKILTKDSNSQLYPLQFLRFFIGIQTKIDVDVAEHWLSLCNYSQCNQIMDWIKGEDESIKLMLYVYLSTHRNVSNNMNYLLYLINKDGIGIESNLDCAREYLSRCVDIHNSLEYIAMLYDSPYENDWKTSFKMCRKVVLKKCNPEANKLLSKMYVDGRYIKKDLL